MPPSTAVATFSPASSSLVGTYTVRLNALDEYNPLALSFSLTFYDEPSNDPAVSAVFP